MRHCMIVDNYYPDIRVERQARALVRRGHSVDVICLRREGDRPREVIDGIRIRRLPVQRQLGMGLGPQMLEYLTFMVWSGALVSVLHLRKRFDVVQVHNVPDFLVFAALVPRLTGAAILLDLHDLMPEFFASRIGGSMDSLAVRLVRVQERASTGFADKVLTVTDLWRRTLIARGLDDAKVDVVMNLPDDALFQPRAPEVRPEPDVITVMYHGTITHRYGIDILVRAVAQARERIPLRLVIHGRGEYLDDLRTLIDELRMGDAVRLSTELLPTADLPDLIAAADIGVVPNRSDVFTDGILPTKLLEYAALGIPAVVSRSTATSAYFTDDMVEYVEPGSVIALATAIERLARDPDRRRKLATAAQAFTTQHQWSDEADRYVNVVERLGKLR
ncbi:MAG: glycosyltransferase family 4 protein [Candidatus Limnocylindria bacterium]